MLHDRQRPQNMRFTSSKASDVRKLLRNVFFSVSLSLLRNLVVVRKRRHRQCGGRRVSLRRPDQQSLSPHRVVKWPCACHCQEETVSPHGHICGQALMTCSFAGRDGSFASMSRRCPNLFSHRLQNGCGRLRPRDVGGAGKQSVSTPLFPTLLPHRRTKEMAHCTRGPQLTSIHAYLFICLSEKC